MQNWIGRYGTTLRDADYVPPPPPEMLQALDALEGYLQSFTDEHPPLVRLAFIHYQFEAIHPFLDGNGRMGRLLIGLLLRSWELLPLPLLYLSAYFERHRSTYYDLLLAVSQRAAWREWVLFFLNGVLEQARDASDRARRLNDLRGGLARPADRLTGRRARPEAGRQPLRQPAAQHPAGAKAAGRVLSHGAAQHREAGGGGDPPAGGRAELRQDLRRRGYPRGGGGAAGSLSTELREYLHLATAI